MKLNRGQLRKLIENAIVDMKGQQSENSTNHAKDINADKDLGTLDNRSQELITIDPGMSVKFNAVCTYENYLEVPRNEGVNTSNPSGHKKIVVKIDNSPLMTTDSDGTIFPPKYLAKKDKERTFYIKNSGSNPVSVRYGFSP